MFGQDGPYSPRTGLDRLGIAYGGLLELTGYADRPPVRPGVSISDYLTGTFAAEAVLAALYRRDRPGGTGTGGVVDAPLYGSILRVMEWTVAGTGPAGHHRGREGNRMSTSAPIDNYPTADGRYVCVVGGSDANFRRLCAAMGRPELADDPRWSDAGAARGTLRRDQRPRRGVDDVADRGRGRGRMRRPRGAGGHRLRARPTCWRTRTSRHAATS